MRKSIDSNNAVASQQVTRRSLPDILLTDESLPELEKGALALGFVSPIEPPPPVAPKIVNAGRDIEIKFSAEVIAARVQEIASKISKKFIDSERQLVVIGVLKGCSPFISDLLRAMDSRILMEVDFVEVNYYGNRLQPTNKASIRLPQTEIEGKDVLLVDDILDTGKTLDRIIEQLYKQKPRSIDACVLVEKTSRQCERVPELKYKGFTLESGWVIGYGMDYEQYYRNLPYVGVLKQAEEYDLSPEI